MRRAGVAALALGVVLLVAAPVAAAQEATPFGPLGPAAPQGEQEQPQPQPAPQPQPQYPERAEDTLGNGEILPLVGMSVLLFLVVAVAIGRDAQRATRSQKQRKKNLTRGSSRPNRRRLRSTA